MGIVLILLGVCFVSGCLEQKQSDSASEKKVSIAGSTTVHPLIEIIAESFNEELDNNVSVIISGGGTGVGINGIVENRIDIAMASREVTAGEREQSPEKKFIETPIGYDAIVIVVSPPVYAGGVKSLTKDQLRGIYAGNITNWKEVGGPDREIYVVGRKSGSGTLTSFNELVMGSATAQSPGVGSTVDGNAEAKGAVAESDKAIGYVGLKFAAGGVNAVKFNGVEASVNTIKDGSYPLARKLYLVTYGNASPEAQQFIDYVVGPKGQSIALVNGYIPL